MPPIGPAISAIAGIGSQLMQNAANRRAEKRAYDRSIEFWNMQNAYNSPVQQMQRLKEAGLNPRLIYGQSSGAAAGNAPSAPSAVQSRAEQFDLGSPLTNMVNQMYDLKMKNAQTNLVNQQAEATRQNTFFEDLLFDDKREGIQRDNFIKGKQEHAIGLENQIKSRLFPYQLQATKLVNEQTRQKIGAFQVSVDQMKSVINNTRARTELIRLQKNMLESGFSPNSPFWWQMIGAHINKK